MTNLQTVDYRGYHIVPQPKKEGDDYWHDGYQIYKEHEVVSSRTDTESVHTNFNAAYDSSILFAKIEIDNLVAIGKTI